MLYIFNRFDRAIRFVDESPWGEDYLLFAFRDSLGIRGIVRVDGTHSWRSEEQAWLDAWEIAEAELTDPVLPEDMAEAESMERDEPDCFAEGYRWTDNGLRHTDLNGEALDRLTPELMAEWELRVVPTHDDGRQCRACTCQAAPGLEHCGRRACAREGE